MKPSVGGNEIITCTEVQQTLAILITFARSVGANYRPPPGKVRTNLSIDIAHDDDHILTWDICKGRLKLVIESQRQDTGFL